MGVPRYPDLGAGGSPGSRDIDAKQPRTDHVQGDARASTQDEKKAISGEHRLLDLVEAERQRLPTHVEKPS